MDLVRISVGPVHVDVEGNGPWDSKIADYFDGFIASSRSATPDLALIHPDHAIRGPRLEGLSPEVAVTVTREDPLRASANSRLSLRGALRFLKRYPDIEYWRHSRWLIFLRNALEFPILAALESRHGYSPLHAAALTGKRGAILLLGENGSGKSTLACQAVARIGVKFASDNFSPYNGESVIAFPGSPKAKPGFNLPSLHPIPGAAEVTAVITVGFAPEMGAHITQRDLLAYISANSEAHRSSGWARIFPTQPGLDRQVSSRLAQLPMLQYDWRQGRLDDVLRFIEEHCA